MSSYKARASRSRDTDDTPPDRPRCPAHGCPFRPVTDPGLTGKMRCTLHAYAEPEDWPWITQEAQRHEWLGQFIGDVQKLANRGGKAAMTWQQFAREFWTGQDDHCLPSADEERNVSAYLYRMFDDLHWRCGTRKNRPEKWADPNKDKPRRVMNGLPQGAEA